MARNLAIPETNVSEAIFAEFYAEWMESNRICKSENAKRNLVLKRAKSAGIPIDAMKQAEKLRQMGSDAVEAQAKDLARVAAWMGVPLFTQASMDLDQKPASPAVTREFARSAGYECGLAGGDRINGNPYVPGSPFNVSWDGGYMAGQTQIAEGLTMTSKKASTAKEKPERKSGKVSLLSAPH